MIERLNFVEHLNRILKYKAFILYLSDRRLALGKNFQNVSTLFIKTWRSMLVFNYCYNYTQ